MNQKVSKSRLLTKVVLLFAFTFAFLFLLEKLYDFLLLQNKNIKASYVLTETVNAELLIHGPCEPLWMIDPKQLDSLTNLDSYNLALSHSNFADNLLHLNFYLKNNKPPEYMLLYVTPESLDERFNTFNTYRFTAHLGDSLVNRICKEFDPAFYRWHQIPFMRHAYYSNFINFKAVQGLKHRLSNRKVPFHPTGYEPPIVQAWHYQFDELIEFYPERTTFVWSDRREKYLRRLLDFAKKKGIKVILYESPVFKKSMVHQLNRGEFVERIQAIAKEKDLPYWVFDDLEMANDVSNFFSTLNTTTKGSVLFTDTLGKHFREQLPR